MNRALLDRATLYLNNNISWSICRFRGDATPRKLYFFGDIKLEALWFCRIVKGGVRAGSSDPRVSRGDHNIATLERRMSGRPEFSFG